MDNLVVVLGSCSIDYTVYSPRLPKPGETIHGTKFMTSHGGKGANQCMAARKLGANTAMIASVGCDQGGKDYIEYFKKANINTEHMTPIPDICTGMAQITVSECGENQIVIVPGANDELSLTAKNRSLIESAKVLICQLETPITTTIEAFKICKGIKILNAAPGMTVVKEELLHLTNILCVNESEAAAIVGFDVESNENIIKALNKLRNYCETVVVTLGCRGAAFVSPDTPVPTITPCPKVKPIDTTGAGDAFCGALAAVLARPERIATDRAVAIACKVASASVTELGTQTSYPTFDTVTLLSEGTARSETI